MVHSRLRRLLGGSFSFSFSAITCWGECPWGSGANVSEHRKTDPVELSNLLRRELDWIVMKALEKDRTRRYQTANDFARDIQRYLHDEPVEACPPSAFYTFSKFTRRNRVVLGMAATSTAALALVCQTNPQHLDRGGRVAL